MRRAARTIGVLMMILCGVPSDSNGADIPPKREATVALQVSFVAEPVELTMVTRDQFRAGVVARNASKTTVNPRLEDTHVTVDGAHSFAFDLAMQNGARDTTWRALPAGKTVRMAWPLGKAFFEKPGKHVVVFTCRDTTATFTVDVRP